ELKIIVPYLIQSEILDSILNLPDHINIKVFTRNKRGYLPSIRQGAQPALDKLKQKKNLKLYIDNRIHAKIWLIDNKFTLVHSMNGTPTSETVNFEAGIMSIKKEVVDEVAQYFQLVESQAERIK
ncbi:MAG: hypothetical protein IH840_17285, partial [Candidatus Heimdallarchaeota archaeon]|nr:hypothetical protein [Candidatus Heimdallarchaeota archaeon]